MALVRRGLKRVAARSNRGLRKTVALVARGMKKLEARAYRNFRKTLVMITRGVKKGTKEQLVAPLERSPPMDTTRHPPKIRETKRIRLKTDPEEKASESATSEGNVAKPSVEKIKKKKKRFVITANDVTVLL